MIYFVSAVCYSLFNINFQLELKITLTTGVQTSGTSEAEDSVIVTTTAEDREDVYPSQCTNTTNIVG